MRIDFDEKTHCYSVNGDIAEISVTELLAKHGLAPNYSGVKKERLKESADIGKKVHKDLENILNKPKYTPTTKQGEQFAKWVKDNLDCGTGEQVLGYEYNGMIICGTADVMGITKKKYNKQMLIVGDHKNTSQFHREYVTWQVNLLDYMARQLGDEAVNGKQLKWKGASKFYCFHYDPKSYEMKVYELDKIPDSEIVDLIDCEYHNKIYHRKELVVDPQLELEFEKAEQFLVESENAYKQAKLKAENVRQQLLELFERQGIKSWETPDKKIKVSYVMPIDRLSVDSNALKKEYPDIYSKVLKLSKVKSSIRVKVREDEE